MSLVVRRHSNLTTSIPLSVLTAADVLSLKTLEAASVAEGYDHLQRLLRDWESGANRFDRDGEILLGVKFEREWIGVSGLNQDLYVEDDCIGRLRHLYVTPTFRRKGVGGALVAELVRRAAMNFKELRLRTNHPAASKFYISQGFEQVANEPSFTHRRWLRSVADGA